MKQSLVLKDLVAIGVFEAIYFVVMFVAGSVPSAIPLGFLLYPFVDAVVCGVIVMLFLAKVKKPWALFIFASFPGVLMTLMGHTWVVLVHSLIVAFIAELIFRKGNFKSFRYNQYAYAVFSLWYVGSLLQMWLMKDAYFDMVKKMMGDVYADGLFALAQPWLIPVLYITAFCGGIIGAQIGKKVLKKHFKKAGII